MFLHSPRHEPVATVPCYSITGSENTLCSMAGSFTTTGQRQDMALLTFMIKIHGLWQSMVYAPIHLILYYRLQLILFLFDAQTLLSRFFLLLTVPLYFCWPHRIFFSISVCAFDRLVYILHYSSQWMSSALMLSFLSAN